MVLFFTVVRYQQTSISKTITICQTQHGVTSTLLMPSSDYSVLSSTVIALNNFNQYCQVVQLFRLTSLIKKSLHHDHT